MAKSDLDIFEQKYFSDFKPVEPLFWRLRLPRAYFEELEMLMASANHEEILGSPVVALCYLAEWYKWRYSPAKNRITLIPRGKR